MLAFSFAISGQNDNLEFMTSRDLQMGFATPLKASATPLAAETVLNTGC